MAQTGDPNGTGTGGSKYPDLPAEFTQGGVQARQRRCGTHSQSPDSANSQFFICFGAGCRQLTGQYTLWGEVIERHGHRRADRPRRASAPARQDAEGLSVGGQEVRAVGNGVGGRSAVMERCRLTDCLLPTRLLPRATEFRDNGHHQRPREHADHGNDQGQSRDRVAPRSRAQARRAHQASWRARASTTASCSTASSTASWRRPAAPRAPAPAARSIPTYRPSSTPSRMCAACARWRARRAPTAPTASSSSASTTPRFLDKQYTVWGKVIEGMDNVDKIKRGEPVAEPRQDQVAESGRGREVTRLTPILFP